MADGEQGTEFTAEPEGGGCLRLGWGCLPVLIVGIGLVPMFGF